MRMTHAITYFLCIFSLFFIVAFYQTITTTEYEKKNRQMAVELSNACMDAFDRIDINDDYFFNTEEKREKTIDGFFESMRTSEGKILFGELEKSGIPFVVLVDYDGFYVYYQAAYNDRSTGCADSMFAMTSRNPFTASLGGYTVMYELKDALKVIKPSGEVLAGTYSELAHLGIFANRNDYEEKKRECIASCIEREVEYLTNSQKVTVSDDYIGYDIAFLTEKGSVFTRLLDKPTIISFMQGQTGRTAKNTLDCFAYARSEMTEGQLYYASGGYYHKLNESSYTAATETSHSVANPVNTYGGKLGTMESLASEGNLAGTDLRH